MGQCPFLYPQHRPFVRSAQLTLPTLTRLSQFSQETIRKQLNR